MREKLSARCRDFVTIYVKNPFLVFIIFFQKIIFFNLLCDFTRFNFAVYFQSAEFEVLLPAIWTKPENLKIWKLFCFQKRTG